MALVLKNTGTTHAPAGGGAANNAIQEVDGVYFIANRPDLIPRNALAIGGLVQSAAASGLAVSSSLPSGVALVTAAIPVLDPKTKQPTGIMSSGPVSGPTALKGRSGYTLTYQDGVFQEQASSQWRASNVASIVTAQGNFETLSGAYANQAADDASAKLGYQLVTSIPFVGTFAAAADQATGGTLAAETQQMANNTAAAAANETPGYGVSAPPPPQAPGTSASGYPTGQSPPPDGPQTTVAQQTGGVTLWPWLLGGALVVGVVILVIALSSGD